MKKFLIFFLFSLLHTSLKAQTLALDSTILHLSVAVDSGRLTSPWDIEWGYDNRLWITDNRAIKVWNPATNGLKTIFRFNKGYGMGLAVPKHAPSGGGPVYVYAVFDTTNYYSGGSLCRIYRFTYDQVADTLLSPTILLSFIHLSEHSGGRIILGADGKLYVTTPEYTFTNDTLGALNGRVLRLNTDGSIPSGNARADYTYTIGHRNPQGLVQLPDGKIYSSEHSGPALYDEINKIELGGHYGWPALQGYNNCVLPMFADSCNSAYFQAHHHKPKYEGILTPSGLDYYDHPAIPEWRNSLIVGTLFQPDSCLAVFKLDAAHDTILSRKNYFKKYGGGINSFERTRDVCVAPDGSIYCIVKDRKFTGSPDSLVNLGAQIINIRNEAYVPPTGIPAAAAENSALRVFPNPADDQLLIECPQQLNRPVAYRIYDINGRLQYKGACTTNKLTRIDTKSWPSGTYLLRTDDRREAISFIIRH